MAGSQPAARPHPGHTTGSCVARTAHLARMCELPCAGFTVQIHVYRSVYYYAAFCIVSAIFLCLLYVPTALHMLKVVIQLK